MKKKVSVIIPTYSRALLINRAIKSVLNQSYKNVEIIVVDDNDPSSDDRKNMELLMKQYEKNEKVIYVKHDKNKNGAAARNTGLRYATGDYVTFLDDDDFYFEDRIKICVEDLENNKNYKAVYTGCVILENKKIKKIVQASKSGNLQMELLKLNPFFGTGSNMFFDVATLKKLNGFDVSFIRHQDIEVMVRFFDENLIYAEKEILVAKVEEDRKNFPNIKNSIIYREFFLNSFHDTISQYSKNEIYEIYYKNYFNLLKLAIRSGSTKYKKDIIKLMKDKKLKIRFKDHLKLFLEKFDRLIDISSCYRYFRKKVYKKYVIKKICSECNKMGVKIEK